MKPWVPLAAVLLAASPLAVVHPLWIEGRSMEPNLRPGEFRWVLRAWAAGSPERDEVWWLDSPDGPAVKRVAGLPGEQVRFQNYQVFVGGRHLPPPPGTRVAFNHGFGVLDCGEGWLFLGDNRDISRDGRFWGPLPRAALKGRVLGL